MPDHPTVPVAEQMRHAEAADFLDAARRSLANRDYYNALTWVNRARDVISDLDRYRNGR